MRKLRIFQPYGYISFDFKEPSAEIYQLVDRHDSAEAADRPFTMAFGDTGKSIVYNKPKVESYDMLTAELASFIESVEAAKPVPVTGEEALGALRVASEIEKIAQAGLDNLRTHLK
jgi:hypothetical protein